MDARFIVRRAAELKAAGAEVLQAACSIELVRQVLGAGPRQRLFDRVTTWLVFLGQTLAADHSCRNAVAQARAAGLVSAKASVHTGAYCQARDRLPEDRLHTLATGLGAELSASERQEDRWHGHRVVVADGSSVSLPDTPANQAAYPQPNTQATGCGFPVMYLCTLLSLASGALLDFTTGSGNGNELTLWRRLWSLLRAGDVVLGDRKYCSYADLALLPARGVDVVARLTGRRKTDFRRGLIFGLRDHLTVWSRPKYPPEWLGSQMLPAEISVRELRFSVQVPGFRATTVTLVTTLKGAQAYPKEALTELFCSRWQVELRLRDIKTMLGMDQLRTKTPERAHRELWMFLAAYNLLRTLMYAAADKGAAMVDRVSFQGCRQRLLAMLAVVPARSFRRCYRWLLRDLAHDLNPDRPFRVEPRAVKRRKKQYDLLNQPRAVLRAKLLGAA